MFESSGSRCCDPPQYSSTNDFYSISSMYKFLTNTCINFSQEIWHVRVSFGVCLVLLSSMSFLEGHGSLLGQVWSFYFYTVTVSFGVCLVLISSMSFLEGLFCSVFLVAFGFGACLFRLLAASGYQKLLRTAKRSAFQPASIKFVEAKTIQNQHKHIIG
jgi:hypothetical protein